MGIIGTLEVRERMKQKEISQIVIHSIVDKINRSQTERGKLIFEVFLYLKEKEKTNDDIGFFSIRSRTVYVRYI